MKAEIENKLLAVIRVRGSVGTRRDIRETLKRLNLRHPNNLVLLFGTKSNIGMLRKCNDFVTYGEINDETLKRLFEKKGVSTETVLDELLLGKRSLREIHAPYLHMHPPRRGYHGAKRSFSNGGALGYRGERINDLVKRML